MKTGINAMATIFILLHVAGYAFGDDLQRINETKENIAEMDLHIRFYHIHNKTYFNNILLTLYIYKHT